MNILSHAVNKIYLNRLLEFTIKATCNTEYDFITLLQATDLFVGHDCDMQPEISLMALIIKARINQHWRQSPNEAQNSAVFLHIKETRHSRMQEQ